MSDVETRERFNDDHEHFFLPDKDDLPETIGLVPLIERILKSAEIVYCKSCDEGYVNPGDDLPSKGEYSIEAVIKKSV